MDPLLDKLITVIFAVLASSGFWAFLQAKLAKNSASNKMLLGIAHDRLIYLCLHYLDKGSITVDAFENLYEYLYKPYKALGGNGTADKLMDEVKKLKICGPEDDEDNIVKLAVK